MGGGGQKTKLRSLLYKNEDYVNDSNNLTFTILLHFITVFKCNRHVINKSPMITCSLPLNVYSYAIVNFSSKRWAKDHKGHREMASPVWIYNHQNHSKHQDMIKVYFIVRLFHTIWLNICGKPSENQVYWFFQQIEILAFYVALVWVKKNTKYKNESLFNLGAITLQNWDMF